MFISWGEEIFYHQAILFQKFLVDFTSQKKSRVYNYGIMITCKVETVINRAVEKYAKETKQHMTDLKTFFSVELGKVTEALNDRPTKEEVREIVKEEMKPLETRVNLIQKEVGVINKKLTQINK